MPPSYLHMIKGTSSCLQFDVPLIWMDVMRKNEVKWKINSHLQLLKLPLLEPLSNNHNCTRHVTTNPRNSLYVSNVHRWHGTKCSPGSHSTRGWHGPNAHLAATQHEGDVGPNAHLAATQHEGDMDQMLTWQPLNTRVTWTKCSPGSTQHEGDVGPMTWTKCSPGSHSTWGWRGTKCSPGSTRHEGDMDQMLTWQPLNTRVTWDWMLTWQHSTWGWRGTNDMGPNAHLAATQHEGDEGDMGPNAHLAATQVTSRNSVYIPHWSYS